MGGASSTNRQTSPATNTPVESFSQQQVVSSAEFQAQQNNDILDRLSQTMPRGFRDNSLINQRNNQMPPRLDIQQTCVVKNPVNLKKKSLMIEKDSVENHIYYLQFDFDASTEAELKIFFECKEDVHPETGIPIFETSSENKPIVRTYPDGMNNHYRSTREEALNLLNHQMHNMQYTENSNIFPIVIQLRSLGKSNMVLSQCTYATLLQKSRDNENAWAIQTIKQKIQFGNKCFEVQEIFGIERGASAGNPTDDFLTGRECVICLAEERNTAVLPCRHMCLCSGCANVMRLQSNKCPICRQSVNSLLQISVAEGVKHSEVALNENVESNLKKEETK